MEETNYFNYKISKSNLKIRNEEIERKSLIGPIIILVICLILVALSFKSFNDELMGSVMEESIVIVIPLAFKLCVKLIVIITCGFLLSKSIVQDLKEKEILVCVEIECNDKLIIIKLDSKDECYKEIFQFSDIKSVVANRSIKIKGRGLKFNQDKKERILSSNFELSEGDRVKFVELLNKKIK